MSSIAAAFARSKKEKRAAFVPYIAAGDPDLATTGELVAALAAAGADLIELGVPFSDPIADGPVNQAAAARAIAGGATLEKILALVAASRRRAGVPIVLFTYFNPVHAYGLARFAEHAAGSGVDGVLCVDLPPEEASGRYREALARHGLDAIFLLSPTSTPARMKAVAKTGSGFVYFVSRTGVTGEQAELPAGLAREVRAVRKAVALPVAVGFGISTPEQVRAVARLADGVVVGSALVRQIHDLAGDRALVERVAGRAAVLARAARRR